MDVEDAHAVQLLSVAVPTNSDAAVGAVKEESSVVDETEAVYSG